MDSYLENIRRMEELTRKQINLALLRKHEARNRAGGKTVDAEVAGLRVGDFYLVTFPAEVTVQVGLNIKAASPHESTFVSGYTNGYLYYAPTAKQMKNRGGAQEDSDCLLAPQWQAHVREKSGPVSLGPGRELKKVSEGLEAEIPKLGSAVGPAVESDLSSVQRETSVEIVFLSVEIDFHFGLPRSTMRTSCHCLTS